MSARIYHALSEHNVHSPSQWAGLVMPGFKAEPVSDARVQGQTGSEPVRTLNRTVLTQTTGAGQPSSARGRFRFSENWVGAEPVRTWFEPLNHLPSRVRVRRISPTMSFFSRHASSKELQGVTDEVGGWANRRTGVDSGEDGQGRGGGRVGKWAGARWEHRSGRQANGGARKVSASWTRAQNHPRGRGVPGRA